jgi:hypothetical protein
MKNNQKQGTMPEGEVWEIFLLEKTQTIKRSAVSSQTKAEEEQRATEICNERNARGDRHRLADVSGMTAVSDMSKYARATACVILSGLCRFLGAAAKDGVHLDMEVHADNVYFLTEVTDAGVRMLTVEPGAADVWVAASTETKEGTKYTLGSLQGRGDRCGERSTECCIKKVSANALGRNSAAVTTSTSPMDGKR